VRWLGGEGLVPQKSALGWMLGVSGNGFDDKSRVSSFQKGGFPLSGKSKNLKTSFKRLSSL
jgi:hypothetical protein